MNSTDKIEEALRKANKINNRNAPKFLELDDFLG